MLGLAEQRELAPKRSSLTNLDYLTTNRSHQDPTNLGAMLRSSYYAWGFRGSSHYASGYRRSSRQRRRRTGNENQSMYPELWVGCDCVLSCSGRFERSDRLAQRLRSYRRICGHVCVRVCVYLCDLCVDMFHCCERCKDSTRTSEPLACRRCKDMTADTGHFSPSLYDVHVSAVSMSVR
ncbi:hypothetical protein IscW_ISCW004587 [Ixodes scapularis]|uniref:Uncharacterized protein n=1 Tax=Ixodes scapularis TaxID=6945 RepID=B7PGG6_IXOSC|nr:hypothetical protein IscW_ISCW004587 [Ixodes scapularis]|eukprot:XP_002434288.1 hypothetical protein IscW_ISCW004587 [Ixodes scapularis]